MLHTSNTLLSGVKALRPICGSGARRDLHAFAARAPARLHVRHADVAHARHPHRADRRAARGRAAQLIQAQGATFAYAATPSSPTWWRETRNCRRCGYSQAPARLFRRRWWQAARERLGLAVAASRADRVRHRDLHPYDGSRAAESDGRAPNGEVRVIDGTLQVRGASLFVGYLKRAHLYRLDADGWFDTGDLARMDAEGYIRICGRSKDVIIRGGENIPVVEIEAALYRIPTVADAAVVAMPDPRLQERACAFVTLRSEARSLEALCRHLAAEGFSKHFGPSGSRCSPRCRAPRPGRSRSSCCGRSRRGFGAAGQPCSVRYFLQ